MPTQKSEKLFNHTVECFVEATRETIRSTGEDPGSVSREALLEGAITLALLWKSNNPQVVLCLTPEEAGKAIYRDIDFDDQLTMEVFDGN